jgi:hypothetical protein
MQPPTACRWHSNDGRKEGVVPERVWANHQLSVRPCAIESLARHGHAGRTATMYPPKNLGRADSTTALATCSNHSTRHTMREHRHPIVKQRTSDLTGRGFHPRQAGRNPDRSSPEWQPPIVHRGRRAPILYSANRLDRARRRTWMRSRSRHKHDDQQRRTDHPDSDQDSHDNRLYQVRQRPGCPDGRPERSFV